MLGFLSDEAIEAITLSNPDLVTTRPGYRLSIGSDPEFMIYCQGSMAKPEIRSDGSIYSYYNEGVSVEEGRVSIDPTAGGEINVSKREFLKTPKSHVKGIAEILLNVPVYFSCPTNMPYLEARVSPYLKTPHRTVSNGGHIHIGMRRRASGFKDLVSSNEYYRKVWAPFLNYLSEYGVEKLTVSRGSRAPTYLLHISELSGPSTSAVANFLGLAAFFISFFAGIPCYLIEPSPERNKRRIYTRYGEFGQYGTPGEGTLELRFPSSWLYSPSVALSALSITYVTAYELVELGLMEDNEIREALIAEYAETIAGLGPEVKLSSEPEDIDNLAAGILPDVEMTYRMAMDSGIDECVRKFYLYPNYSDSIERLLKWVDIGWEWEPESDILANWINSGILEQLRERTPIRDSEYSSFREVLG